ncbi:MAG: ABC transporter permease subunit [Anaerolineales bacterium]
MTNTKAIGRSKTSFLHGALSLIVPGSGQFAAGARARGLTFFLSVVVLGSLSVWTIAQEARFPDYNLSFVIFSKLVVETALLLLFLLALQRLFTRYIVRDPALGAFSAYGLGILFFLAVIFASDQLLGMAASPEQLALVYGGTALFSAAALAALWLWQVGDAARIGAQDSLKHQPSMALPIFLICLLIFSLGYNITRVNLPKAISEYQDISILLPRILWPWRSAFAYDQEVVEEAQLIQAPCPDGAVGPPSNEPEANDPWISATPTCGEIGVRDISGTFTPGTPLAITGGNFVPGQIVQILWKNPIGNAFRPRGVGETDILIDENGGFTTQMNIPDVVIPEATASGDQIHTLLVRQEDVEVFGWRFSDDMNLALIGMLETIMMGLMATFFGMIFAFPISFLAARNLMTPIVTPLNRIVGGIVGLVAGVWIASDLTGRAAAALGGLETAPIQIFLIGMTLVLALGYAGMTLAGRLFGFLLERLGGAANDVISAVLLAAVVSVPGYYLGLGFSRGIRSIVLGEDIAAINEISYAYGGAVVLAVLALAYAWRNRGGRGIPIGSMVYGVTRTILNALRSVEALIYAIVFSIWVGLGPFAGTLALTLHTIASLAKLYSEAIESIEPGPLEALYATGATRLQTIIYAVIPQILPPAISFTVYRWDINVRMSTIIGFVGGGGIGFIMLQWQRLYQWELVGIAVWLIAITVATLDYVSAEIRQRTI